MKAALSIVLAALLIILPVEQVLAQAAQQEAVSVQQTQPLGGAAQLFRVPPLTDNSARLLGASSERVLLNTPFAESSLSNTDAVVQSPSGSSTKKKIWIGVAVVAGIVALAFLISRLCPTGCGGLGGQP